MPSLLKYLPLKVRKLAKVNPAAVRYITDGFLAMGAINIANSNFNLFAVRLGASDFQLSLVQFLPQIFTMLILIPGGILMDSLHNKKRIVIIMILAVMLGYLLCAVSPFAADYAIHFFLGSVAFAVGAVALYNIAWQSYFPGVIDSKMRNYVLTLRTRVILIVSMLAPLLVGIVLMNIKNVNGKIIAHQAFFISAILLLILAIPNFKRFRTMKQNTLPEIEPKKITLDEIKNASKSLLHNKKFLLFAAAALYFHMTWHSDWTLYFIGQVQYLKMNELQLGLVLLGAAATQLLTIKFWSRKNEKHGVVLPFIFGVLGLSLFPIIMIICVSIPIGYGPHLFVILHTAGHIAFCVITLNLYQCILLVIDNKYRSFYLSVFACMLCLSNAIMPVAGVLLYHSLGGDLNGLRYTFAIIFVVRIIAALLWFLWYRYQRGV